MKKERLSLLTPSSGSDSRHRHRRMHITGKGSRSLVLGGLLVLAFVYSVLHLCALPATPASTAQPSFLQGPHGMTWRQFADMRRATRPQRPQRVLGKQSLAQYLQRAKAGPFPIKLKYPLLWCGALFSKSGYGTEALSYVASLLQLNLVTADDVWVSQSGDYIHDEVVQTMDPTSRQQLYRHHYRNITQILPRRKAARPVIAVCHSFPDCWRMPKDDHKHWVKKTLDAIGNFFKYKVLRKKYQDNGCPCPHNDIAPQVVYRVGRTMFETELLPKPLVRYAQNMDEVWVPSEWNVQSFIQSGIEPHKLFTLYEGINVTQYNPDMTQPMDLSKLGGSLVAGRPATEASVQKRLARKKQEATNMGGSVTAPAAVSSETGLYRFLSVFKWEVRKGWDILLQNYVAEFRGVADVELHIVTKAAFEKVKDWPRHFRKVAAPYLNITHESQWDDLPRIILHTSHIPDADYPGMYAAMDALVIPTHGEGWGRPQIEAMAMGLPVISTNWSGLTAFINDKVAYPIRVAGLVDIKNEDFDMFKGQRWAQPDAAHLRQLMREVFTNRQAAALKGSRARAHIAQGFSELAVAQQLVALILRAQDVVDDLLWGDSAAGYRPLRRRSGEGQWTARNSSHGAVALSAGRSKGSVAGAGQQQDGPTRIGNQRHRGRRQANGLGQGRQGRDGKRLRHRGVRPGAAAADYAEE